MPIYIDGHRTVFRDCVCRDGVIHLTTGARELAAAAAAVGSGVDRPEAPAAPPGPALCHLAGPGLPSTPETEPEVTTSGPPALPESTDHTSSDEAFLDNDTGKFSMHVLVRGKQLYTV